MVEFKVGDRVKATDDCNNDFSGGEGVIEHIRTHFGDKEMLIRVTKKSRWYNVGSCTTYASWYRDIELMVDPNNLPEDPNG